MLKYMKITSKEIYLITYQIDNSCWIRVDVLGEGDVIDYKQVWDMPTTELEITPVLRLIAADRNTTTHSYYRWKYCVFKCYK